MGHPIQEAKLLLAASRAVARLAPGNGLTGQLSARSRAGGNTISITMARNEVDPSLITDEPSYANNTDNISADKDEVVKRMRLIGNHREHFF